MNIVAKAIVRDAYANILILQRSGSHPQYALEADLPGGIVESAEDPITAVIREIEEETGIIVTEDNVRFLHQRTTLSQSGHLLFDVFINLPKPVVKLSWEHENYVWVSKEDFALNINTTDDYMIVVDEWLSTQS